MNDITRPRHEDAARRDERPFDGYKARRQASFKGNEIYRPVAWTEDSREEEEPAREEK